MDSILSLNGIFCSLSIVQQHFKGIWPQYGTLEVFRTDFLFEKEKSYMKRLKLLETIPVTPRAGK